LAVGFVTDKKRRINRMVVAYRGPGRVLHKAVSA
jgi:hypothetical protein